MRARARVCEGGATCCSGRWAAGGGTGVRDPGRPQAGAGAAHWNIDGTALVNTQTQTHTQTHAKNNKQNGLL